MKKPWGSLIVALLPAISVLAQYFGIALPPNLHEILVGTGVLGVAKLAVSDPVVER